MFRSISLSLALICPFAASAQSLSFDGWSLEGTIAAGATDVLGGSGIGAIDATLKIPLSRRVPLSFEIGTHLFALDGKRPHETYAAFNWDDTWRLGAVRPAYDLVLPSVFARAAPYLAYERAEFTRAHATVEAMRRTAVPWGLSWTQSFGQTDLALSVHDAEKGGFRTASASVRYRGDGWQVAAAVESVWSRDNAHDGVNAKLGARFDLGRADLGVTLMHPEANGKPDALALDVVFPVGTRLDVMAFGEITRDGSDDAYGLALDYKLRPDTSFLFAVTDGAAGSAAHLTLEYRF